MPKPATTMRKLSLLFVAVGAIGTALAVSVCFSPDSEDPLDDSSGETDGPDSGVTPSEDDCHDLGDSCQSNGDCCDFNESPQVGTALCVDDGAGGRCAAVCVANDTCMTDCCGGLEGITDYGTCSSPNTCSSGNGFLQGDPSCLAGVEFFCECGASVDVPCTDDDWTTFTESCKSEGNASFAVFRCIDEMSFSGCLAVLDACVPSEAGVEPKHSTTVKARETPKAAADDAVSHRDRNDGTASIPASDVDALRALIRERRPGRKTLAAP